jgi:tRNA uridine 5-carboxymethylaminomethyl modification enzyme
MGCNVALITADPAAIGRMSCNPAIGGSAKGHLVHEIDALGGVMGQLADATGIQFRLLNRSKGPAIWSSRCQSDSVAYARAAADLVAREPGLLVVAADAIDFVPDPGAPVGRLILADGQELACRRLVVCSGTFLNGVLHTGEAAQPGGRVGERPATGLSTAFERLGIVTGRLKTGTPPRLRATSVDFAELAEQPGDAEPLPFSHRTDRSRFPLLRQVSCHITHTNATTHLELERGFDRSPMFTGKIQAPGPRYCPSIEDKIVRFPDRTGHQLFLEPEGLDSELIYLNGFSSSLPAEVQSAALRTIPGLRDAEVVRFGYAVEYDYFPAYQLDLTLESKELRGLYFAGQVNGTSGYEEAAAQGLLAGINAARAVRGEQEFVLGRDQAYIGVLIDDLVTKPSHEPYRIFTSLAEHRLILRQDNASRRLAQHGVRMGLLDADRGQQVAAEQLAIDTLLSALETTRVTPAAANSWLQSLGTSPLQAAETLATLARRPEVGLQGLNRMQELPLAIKDLMATTPDATLAAGAIELKYQGYVRRESAAMARMQRLEGMRIPPATDYESLAALSNEAREKLARLRPRTLGQAARMAGVSPADVSVLMVWLRGRGRAPVAVN